MFFSVRLGVNYHNTDGQWYWVNKEEVLQEWIESNDIIFKKGTSFNTILKSLYGAPPFTIDELKIWEKCFNQVGVYKVGKYPSIKRLKTKGLLGC